jgi:hypothetical protein
MWLMPVKTSSVFKSRWKALLWAGGILFFAYTIAGSLPASNTANASANADQATDSDGNATQKIPATWN